MKQTLIVLGSVLLMATAANAQKGSVYIGGNAGFGSSKVKSEVGGNSNDLSKQTNWSFSPEIGTFLTDNVQLGIALSAGGGKSDNMSNPATITKSNHYGATLYGRHFFGKEAFKPFVGLNVSAAPGNSETKLGNAITAESKTFNYGANLNAGFGYALSKRVTAVGSFGVLGYSSVSSTNKQTDVKITTNNFGLDAGTLGNRFTVGVYYTL